jgi:hypothetical protein
VRQEGAAGVGQDDPAAGALEKRRLQLLLEEVKSATDRRLREVQRGRGAREATAPHDRHERLDLVEVHRAHQHSA